MMFVFCIIYMNNGYAGKIKNCSTCNKMEDSGLSKKVLNFNGRQLCKLYTNSKDQNYKSLLRKELNKRLISDCLNTNWGKEIKVDFIKKGLCYLRY